MNTIKLIHIHFEVSVKKECGESFVVSKNINELIDQSAEKFRKYRCGFFVFNTIYNLDRNKYIKNV